MILAGDIGGTKINLALYDGLTRLREERYASQDFSSLDQILDDFLRGHRSRIEKACFGVAGPVVDGKCSLTNLSWQIETENIKKKLDLDAVCLINDLVATAFSIPFLAPENLEVIQSGIPNPDGRISVVSAGTGLGQAFLIPETNKKFIVLDSEGGHCDFSPRNSMESELLLFLKKKYSRVSIERVLSGPGLLDIYGFFRVLANEGEFETIDTPASIVKRALAKSSPVCEQTLKLFVSLYGALAGNLVLQYLSNGGIFLAGGIAPKIVPLLRDGNFMEAFLAKGRFEKYLLKVPVKVVMDESAPLLGAAQYATTL
jgi:glucokinase